MEHDVKVWLMDMDRAITEIFHFLPEKKVFSEFQRDLKTKRAVERNIGIIGEALNRILKVQPSIAITHSRRIVDTRNRVIHGYDSVSDDIIWGIVIRELKPLQNEVRELLGDQYR
jgi:uncharacterized protein with HEPN domain